jgi:enamine deaminase RidA (YjgF/YER057c/UK114 family)
MTTERLRFGNPDGLYDPAPNGYSHVAIIPPGAAQIFISGQGGEEADGTLDNDFAVQVGRSLDNLEIALAWAGARLHDVVKLTLLVVGHDECRHDILSAAVNARFQQRMTPACSLIPVPRLALDGMLIEIEAIAAVVEPGRRLRDIQSTSIGVD